MTIARFLIILLIVGAPPTFVAVGCIVASRSWAASRVWTKRLVRWSLNLLGAVYILVSLAAIAFFWIGAFIPDSDGDQIPPYEFIAAGFAWFSLPLLSGVGLVREGYSDRLMT